MTTAARIREGANAHWYHQNGDPCHTVPKKDGSGDRPATLADARKLGLLRSVTTYLKALAKPELDAWKQEQACLAVLTSPQLPGEGLDAFVHRVLHEEEQHRQEAKSKADLGKLIHGALQKRFTNLSAGIFIPWPEDMAPYVEPVYQHLMDMLDSARAHKFHTELSLIGDGYAGCTDLIAVCAELDYLIDWKSTGTLPPKGSWLEHKLQLAAYAAAWAHTSANLKPVATVNIYISNKEPGQFVAHVNPPWEDTYNKGFKPIVDLVCWMDNYDPRLEVKP